MKTREHAEYLLKQGKKPKELVELGFPKALVTRIRRQLSENKASEGKVGSKVRPSPSDLIARVEALEASIAAIPLSGLKQRFKCDCGASGLVAVNIKCTKCSKEAWWGWWPKETDSPPE